MSENAPPPEWRPLKTPGLMRAIGPLLSRRDGKNWRYGLATGPQHANPAGLIHGGTLTALLDHAMSLVAWNAVKRQPVVTIQMNTNFLAAARPGEFLEVDVTLRKQSGSVLFVDATVTSGEREIASASCIMKTLATRPTEG